MLGVLRENSIEQGARFGLVGKDNRARVSSFGEGYCRVQSQARPLLRRTVAGEAFFGKERADMGFERIVILGDRALAHGNRGRYQNGGRYQQSQEQRSKEEQGRGEDPDAESLRKKMLKVEHGSGGGWGSWGPRA